MPNSGSVTVWITQLKVWQLPVLLTGCTASRLIRHQRALQGGAVRQALVLEEDDAKVLAEVIGREPMAAFAAQVAEESRQLLEGLKASPRDMVVAKRDGPIYPEIAADQEVSEPSVERNRAVIRKLWKGKDQP
jgi:hypothetical protein